MPLKQPYNVSKDPYMTSQQTPCMIHDSFNWGQKGPQGVVAGDATSKSGGGTDQSIHAILAHNTNFHSAAISRSPVFWFPYFFQWRNEAKAMKTKQ